MSDAGVFHHFNTKRDILAALLARPYDAMPARGADEPVSDEASLEALVMSTLDAAGMNEPLLRVLIRQQLVGDPEASETRTIALENWRKTLLQWFSAYRPKTPSCSSTAL